MDRREMLKLVCGGALATLAWPWSEAEGRIKPSTVRQTGKRRVKQVPAPSAGPARSNPSTTGTVAFHNVHTGDAIEVRYLNHMGQADSLACRRLNQFFRCQVTGRTTFIHPALFVLLDAVRTSLAIEDEPFLLYSGYRSPAYNRLLAKKDRQVARHSFHTRGMAADVALSGVSLADLERVAGSLQMGGVGRYDQFVHLDIGPPRLW
jgi:uncharacterized protein YcbK (DUF882 family)